MAFLISLPTRRTEAPPRPASRMPEAEAGSENAINISGVEGRTRITTSFGEVPAQLLRVNDAVRTRDGRFLKIKSIDKVRLDSDFLKCHPDALPVRVPANTLGTGRPDADIYLAPDQKIGGGVSVGDRTQCAARALMTRPRVVREASEMVTYYRINLGEPAAIMSEKIWIYVS